MDQLIVRGNAEIQRRAQEVIDRCWQAGAANPILSIHDVGAGGLSNALPELIHGGHAGGTIDLRAAPSQEPGMSPREIWCNEAQERYVLAILPANLDGCRCAAAHFSEWTGAGTSSTEHHHKTCRTNESQGIPGAKPRQDSRTDREQPVSIPRWLGAFAD